MSKFVSTMAKVASIHFYEPTHPTWKELAYQVDQAVLDSAAAQSYSVQKTLADKSYTLVERGCKKMERIEIKRSNIRNEEYFKVVCDFIAFRISCEVEDIMKNAEILQGQIKGLGGICRVRGSIIDTNGKYTDIVLYVYGYIPQFEFPIEFQIIHPFAAYTFMVDSALRDDPTYDCPDMWTNGVYEKGRQYLLDKANGSVKPGQMYEFFDAVHNLHKGRVHDNLRMILNQIYSKV